MLLLERGEIAHSPRVGPLDYDGKARGDHIAGV